MEWLNHIELQPSRIDPPGGAGDATDIWHARGIEAYGRADCLAAVDCFSEAIARSAPYHPLLHFLGSFLHGRLGDACLEMQRYEQAAREYGKAIFQEHENTGALAGRIVACLHLGRKENVEKERSALRKMGLPVENLGDDPQEWNALRSRFSLYDKPICFDWRAGDDGGVKALFDCGAAHRDAGRLEDAIAAWSEALRIHGARHDHYHRGASLQHLHRGYAQLRLGELDLAIADFSKAIDLDRNHAPPYLARARCYAHKGDAMAEALDLQRWSAVEAPSGPF